MLNQVFRTAIGTECAPRYVCLTIVYQEETKLFTQELRKYFSMKDCVLIKEGFKRYIDYGSIFGQDI